MTLTPHDDPSPTTAALDVFVHDLRNSIAAAMGRQALIQRRLKRGDVDCARLAEELAAVESALRKVLTMVDGLSPGPAVVVGPLVGAAVDRAAIA